MPSLLDPIRLGDIDCHNRVFMSPLTRARATPGHVPTPMMVEYYAQRAGAGLIISEATGINQEGLGWPWAPGIWSAAQVEAWKPVTEAVHAKGGRIVCQLWHMGRLVHPSFLNGGKPVAPSVLPPAPGHAHTYAGNQPYAESRAFTGDEIKSLIADYEIASRNAIAAGFDGVALHGANGYLIDQFLRDGTNKRTDIYGGGPEGRVRVLHDAVEAMIAGAGAGRVSVRLSPLGDFQGCNDSHPESVFGLAATTLGKLGIAFLEIRQHEPDAAHDKAQVEGMNRLMQQNFGGIFVLNKGFDGASAEAAIAEGRADAITFGRYFISNPDLAERLAKNRPLAKFNPATFYSQGAEGYIDYPVYAE